MRRDVWDDVGPLDERFEIGLFEDDDFSMRVRPPGYRVVCAEDVFVHHFGQASIGRLGADRRYGALFHANRARWEEKWGRAWRRTRSVRGRRTTRSSTLRQFVSDAVPPGATVLVVSKGDDELLRSTAAAAGISRRPRAAYAGHYPADSDACIAELERLRQRGAEFLVIPETVAVVAAALRQFADHLDTHYGAPR